MQREGRISAYREVPKQWIDCLTAAALREDNALFTEELKRAVTALAAEARSRREALLLDSIGGGLVPITRRERALRDAVGRLQCALAAAADEVYLLELGIARPLKKFGESVEKL
ncbi:MAG: bifunctional adenosylcobinamide kinase/adenosylcobinamide-phosphate guanylyltransferase [Stomatobaculum longum]|nr:bifunctional adenosylcobinamide kinase/adenosylcobinamide-phosphate guanylyltransferase [Stomatobaculum longum]